MTDNRVSLSVKQYAERHSVSTRTVWRWIKAGRVPIQRLGPRTVRIVLSIHREKFVSSDIAGHTGSTS